MTRPLIEAAAAFCDQQERWAHAEFYYHTDPGSRGRLAAAGEQPWRGIMSPSILHMIHVLEEMGEYEAPALPRGRAA